MTQTHMTHSKRAPHGNQSVSCFPKKIEIKNNVGTHPALWSSHHVDTGWANSALEVHAAAIIKVGVKWVSAHVRVSTHYRASVLSTRHVACVFHTHRSHTSTATWWPSESYFWWNFLVHCPHWPIPAAPPPWLYCTNASTRALTVHSS
jgi:hypothetical protein